MEDSPRPYEAFLIAFLVLMMGQWRSLSLVLQCHDHPPFCFHSPGTVPLPPLRLWSWLNCLLIAYLVSSEVSYFPYHLKGTAAGGTLLFLTGLIPTFKAAGVSQGYFIWPWPLRTSFPGAGYFSPSTVFNGSWFILNPKGFLSICSSLDKLFKPTLSQHKWPPIQAGLMQSNAFSSAFTKFSLKRKAKLKFLSSSLIAAVVLHQSVIVCIFPDKYCVCCDLYSQWKAKYRSPL